MYVVSNGSVGLSKVTNEEKISYAHHIIFTKNGKKKFGPPARDYDCLVDS